METDLRCFDCIPTTAESERIVKDSIASAKSAETLWEKQSSMPVISWSSFAEKLPAWIDEADELRDRGICTLPHVVLKAMPDDRVADRRLFFSQGPVNSCAFHGDAFAYHRSLLRNIAHGAPLVYKSVNPFVGYWLSSPGNRGGRGIAQTAQFSNQSGHWLADDVGDDNTSMPDDYESYAQSALSAQSGIVYIEGDGDELVRNVIKCLRADFGVFWGNTTAIRGCRIDANGVKVASLGGGWAHATSGHGYRRIGGDEYLLVANSHGGIYDGSKEGDPDDCVWMDSETFRAYADSFTYYDRPVCVLAEGTVKEDWSLRSKLDLKFPEGFRR